MVYTNITQKGMSGSPVIDTGGRLIGIHAAEGDSISINQETGEKREPNSVIACIPIRTFGASAAGKGDGAEIERRLFCHRD